MFNGEIKNKTGPDLMTVSGKVQLRFMKAIAKMIESNSDIVYFDESSGYLTADKLVGSKITFSMRDYEIVIDTLSPYTKVAISVDLTYESVGKNRETEILDITNDRVVGSYEKFSYVMSELIKMRDKFTECYNDFNTLPFGEFLEKYDLQEN